MTPVARQVFRLLALPALCVAACAHAQDSNWSFQGFGSIGAVHSTEKQADYAANVLYPGMAGYSREWSPEVDSRLGAQLSVDLGKRWSVVLQVVSEHNLENSWKPALEWANVKYQVSPELSVRLGRIALPVFLAGDYRKAGFALPWVRPPVELYGALPISSSDGVDASYQWQGGGIKHTTQVFYGSTRHQLGAGNRSRVHGLSGVAHATTAGALMLRGGVTTASLTIDAGQELFDGLRQFGPVGQQLARRYEIRDKRVLVLNAGLSYDPGDWFVMAEAARFNYNSGLGDFYGAYASGGIRLGAWTPYLLAARSRALMPTQVAGLPLAGLPPDAAATAAALNGYLNTFLSAIPQQASVAVGVRWDVSAGMALKLQYDRLHTRNGSSGTFLHVQPGFRSGRHVGVTSVLLDFVF
ncbi:MAG: hypothetical protein K2X55_28825 [Burkholderiaceae bacterium]|nr:hypothetical protein [Burkholderiaceae bacterium]